MKIWDQEAVSGTRVASALLDGHGGMKVVILFRLPEGKVKTHVFHAASGEEVKRLTAGAKEDIKKLKADFGAISSDE